MKKRPVITRLIAAAVFTAAVTGAVVSDAVAAPMRVIERDG